MVHTPVRFAALRFGSPATDSQHSTDFLRTRLASFARLVGFLFLGLWITGALALAVLQPQLFTQVHGHPSKLINLALGICLPILAAFLGKRQLGPSLLAAIDVALPLSVSLAIGVAVAHVPPSVHLEFAGLLVEVLTLALRAALVPSTPGRTALIGVLCAPPLIIGGYIAASGASDAYRLVTPEVVAGVLTTWCMAAVAVTTVVSRVIYGLVAQVNEARRLGQYTLREKLGEGGMGVVYRAEHALLRRPTAVKLLLPERNDPEALARFEREVQLTSQLSHPNTVSIYDYGRTPEGTLYYAMEFLEGVTLQRLVETDGPQSPARVIHIMRQIAGSLCEAHARNLIHRDIKPSNLLLCERGAVSDVVKVIDFGLVRPFVGNDANVTQVGTIAGTPLYMSPECITDPQNIGAASDVYSLGCVGYFLITGAPPFRAGSAVEVCGHHLHTLPDRPSLRVALPLPAELEETLLLCLDKSAAKRPSATQLRRTLDDYAKQQPWAID